MGTIHRGGGIIAGSTGVYGAGVDEALEQIQRSFVRCAAAIDRVCHPALSTTVRMISGNWKSTCSDEQCQRCALVVVSDPEVELVGADA